MKFIHHEKNGHKIAELVSLASPIRDTGDMLDLFGNAGAGTIIIKKEMLDESFFDLKTRLAGELLQKLSNYRKRMAVVGDFSSYDSENLKAFIRESNRSGQVLFTESTDEAIRRFAV